MSALKELKNHETTVWCRARILRLISDVLVFKESISPIASGIVEDDCTCPTPIYEAEYPLVCSTTLRAMSTFTFLKGLADSVVGIILLTKPAIIYHSAVARFLHERSGLRLPNPNPNSLETLGAQHAVAIMVSNL